MAKYYVRVSATCTEDFEIEAKSYDEAEQEALDQMSCEYSGEFDLEIDDSYCIDNGDKEEDE